MRRTCNGQCFAQACASLRQQLHDHQQRNHSQILQQKDTERRFARPCAHLIFVFEQLQDESGGGQS